VNDRELRWLLERLVLLASPLPLAFAGSACGGSVISADASGSAGAHAAGSSSTGGGAGAFGLGGSGVAGWVAGGSGGGGTSSGGGGTSSGGGGTSSGGGGTSSGGGGTSSGGGGAGGVSGNAGSGACIGSQAPVPCGGGRQEAVPKTCLEPALETVGTVLPSDKCLMFCNSSGFFSACSVAAVDDASVTVLCTSGCATGRRPAGLCKPLAFDTSSVGAYFASVARLEAASVDAFRILRDELRAHGAPKKLVRAAARAARDEIRHTRATGALARRFGARLEAATLERPAVRSIATMALENAVEGCVRETYGALLATWQARTARDPVVRAAMTRIARDERRHAVLSWNVGRWLETRLDRRAKYQVEAAKQAAARELLSSLANELELSFAEVVGLPAPAQGLRLAREMQHTLWS